MEILTYCRLLRVVTGASQLVAKEAVLNLIIVFIKILNTEIVDIVFLKKKTTKSNDLRSPKV